MCAREKTSTTRPPGLTLVSLRRKPGFHDVLAELEAFELRNDPLGGRALARVVEPLPGPWYPPGTRSPRSGPGAAEALSTILVEMKEIVPKGSNGSRCRGTNRAGLPCRRHAATVAGFC